ncbi:hypothetical protein [Streptomyces sp. SM10]|nr:hypothetical protein [Streptomyces sp. SM10]
MPGVSLPWFLGSGEITDINVLRSCLIGTMRSVNPDSARAAQYTQLHSR